MTIDIPSWFLVLIGCYLFWPVMAVIALLVIVLIVAILSTLFDFLFR